MYSMGKLAFLVHCMIQPFTILILHSLFVPVESNDRYFSCIHLYHLYLYILQYHTWNVVDMES